MTKPDIETGDHSGTITGLLEKCVSLCAEVESVVEGRSGDRGSFLESSLEDALQQLELVLRGMARKDSAAEPDKGFLSRLFARNESKSTDADADESEPSPPDVGISSHGFQGDSWTITLSELLGFLGYARKTGVLWVDTPNENFLIGLLDGNVMHATSNHTPEGLRLGEVLVAFGFLTQRQLERYLTQHRKDESATSGEVLLEGGMISEGELQQALAYQVQQVVCRMVETKNAVFRFRDGMRIELAYHVNLNLDRLLLESARVLDESTHDSDMQAATLDALDSRGDEGSDASSDEAATETESDEDADEPDTKSDAKPAA